MGLNFPSFYFYRFNYNQHENSITQDCSWLAYFSCFNVNGQSVQLNWAAHDGGPGINEDYASGTTQDAQGNTYITGMVAEAMGLSVINSIMTVKLDPNGDVLWKKYYINPTGDNCYPTGIAYDGSSAIYITGNALDGSQHSQIILMKYDLSGSLQWIRQYSDPATDSDLSNGIAIGSANQIYLAASCQDSLATTSQFRTIKYDANGNFQWQKDFHLDLQEPTRPVQFVRMHPATVMSPGIAGQRINITMW